MKGSVTGEVCTIISFWLKGDSLNRGWHRQRDLEYGSDIRRRSLHTQKTSPPYSCPELDHRTVAGYELGCLNYETGKGQVWASRHLRWGQYLGNTALVGSAKAALQGW